MLEKNDNFLKMKRVLGVCNEYKVSLVALMPW